MCKMIDAVLNFDALPSPQKQLKHCLNVDKNFDSSYLDYAIFRAKCFLTLFLVATNYAKNKAKNPSNFEIFARF